MLSLVHSHSALWDTYYILLFKTIPCVQIAGGWLQSSCAGLYEQTGDSKSTSNHREDTTTW